MALSAEDGARVQLESESAAGREPPPAVERGALRSGGGSKALAKTIGVLDCKLMDRTRVAIQRCPIRMNSCL